MMDPVSITVACVSLTASIAKTSAAVTTFVHTIRSARSDLDGVSRELASLKTLLELITEDAKDVKAFPDTLRKHISGILANCELVLVEVQRLIVKHDEQSVISNSKWAWAGREDVARLQLSLEAHKSALEIALEMVTLSMSKQIMSDTTHLRDDTAAIKQETSEILEEIARLRAQLPSGQVTLPLLNRDRDVMLARYLDDLTSYAETVCWSEVNDNGMDLYDEPSPTRHKFKSPYGSMNAPVVRNPSIASTSSHVPNSVSDLPLKEHVSQITTTESTALSHESAETDPFASTHELDEEITSDSPSDGSIGATVQQQSLQIGQGRIERSELIEPEAPKPSPRQPSHSKQGSNTSRSTPTRKLHVTNASTSNELTKHMTTENITPSIVPLTRPEAWTNSGPVQHSSGLLAWHQNKVTKEFLVVKSYRAIDMNFRRRARAEVCGLLNHPHLASLRYIARTSGSWMTYMDPGDATTTLTYYVSAYHHNWSLVPESDRVDSHWWENWSCKVGRQIGSALRYCYMQFIAYGSLRSDDIFVTNTGDIKLVGFDILESDDMSRDQQAFTTFTFGTVIWYMACGTPPWAEKENVERFKNSRSSMLARPPGMSFECFSLVAGLLCKPIPSNRSSLFSLQEALDHPWMKFVHPERPPHYMPQRTPLLGSFDESNIQRLVAMGFGNDNQEVQQKLDTTVNSPEYMTAVIAWTRDQKRITSQDKPFGIRKSIMLALSERRRIEETLQRHHRPQGDFYELLAQSRPSPLLAMYYLIKERREWEALSKKERLWTSTSTQSLDMSRQPNYRYG